MILCGLLISSVDGVVRILREISSRKESRNGAAVAFARGDSLAAQRRPAQARKRMGRKTSAWFVRNDDIGERWLEGRNHTLRSNGGVRRQEQNPSLGGRDDVSRRVQGGTGLGQFLRESKKGLQLI